MIETSLIDSARLIKKEFESLNEILVSYESDVKKLANNFITISSDLKKIDTKGTLEKLRDNVMSKLNDLETESNNVCDKINNINKRLESLKKEENDLFITIKKRHPSLSNDEIKIEIQRHL